MSDLAARYGTHRPGRRIALIGISTLLALAFGTWLAWAAWFHSDQPIRAEVAAYRVVDAHEVQVKLATQVRTGAQGTCLVRATAADHTIVGELNLRVADLLRSDGDWISLRTEREATTVQLVRCTQD